METAIKTENLSRSFGTVQALDQLSLEVPGGIVFGFLGPNGSGKTTTIRLLLGLLAPQGGSARVLGCDVLTQSDRIREQAGVLLEHHGLYERMSARDNLEFYGRIYRLSPEARDQRIRELLTHFGLWDRRDQLVKDFSRGMKQKVAVARALLARPPIIFFDEPTEGLDPVAAAALREDISGLVDREGITVFLTTHNLPEAEKLCDQVGVISAGKLLAVGNLDQLRQSQGTTQLAVIGRGFTQEALDLLKRTPAVQSLDLEQNGRLLVSLTQQADSSALVALLVNQGVKIEEVHKHSASLEEIFLELVGEDGHGN